MDPALEAPLPDSPVDAPVVAPPENPVDQPTGDQPPLFAGRYKDAQTGERALVGANEALKTVRLALGFAPDAPLTKVLARVHEMQSRNVLDLGLPPAEQDDSLLPPGDAAPGQGSEVPSATPPLSLEERIRQYEAEGMLRSEAMREARRDQQIENLLGVVQQTVARDNLRDQQAREQQAFVRARGPEGSARQQVFDQHVPLMLNMAKDARFRNLSPDLMFATAVGLTALHQIQGAASGGNGNGADDLAPVTRDKVALSAHEGRGRVPGSRTSISIPAELQQDAEAIGLSVDDLASAFDAAGAPALGFSMSDVPTRKTR